MARQIIDISIALDNETPADQPGFVPTIEYQDPKSNVPEILRFFPGLTVDQLPGGEGWGNETVKLRTHSGTHLDTPYHYRTTKDPGIIWEGHRAGMEIGYCHLEKLHNLESLPEKGFQVSCFPVKIQGASAGWTRAVAIRGLVHIGNADARLGCRRVSYDPKSKSN